MLHKATTRVDPHYLDVWQLAHQGNTDAVERLVSISFYSYTIFVTFTLNSIFLGPLYGGVEEDARSSARRLEVGPLQRRRCICYRRRYLAWKASEYINYCLTLSNVSL
jgi:hypothetical protein